jgi:hypothetical protein
MASMIVIKGEQHVSKYPTSRILSLAEPFLPRLIGPSISIYIHPLSTCMPDQWRNIKEIGQTARREGFHMADCTFEISS